MTTNHLRRAALLAMIALLAPRAIAQDTLQPAEQPEHAPVFSDLSPAEAGRLASKEGKLLIIKGTAVWCGPCKQMDRTTFRDQRIIDWIDLYAVAVELDVDERPGGAKALRISAMPTIIAFRGKTEIDRVVGYQAADELLAFFQNVRSGKTREQRGAEEAEALKKRAEGGDMGARLEHARTLLREQRYEDATEEFEWLWNHVLEHDLAFAGVRGSFMAGDMQQLAAAHPRARERFAGIRDSLADRIQPGPGFDAEALDDWIVLNRVVADDSRTLQWVDSVKDLPEHDRYFARSDFRLYRILVRHGRWSLAGTIHADPAGEARRTVAIYSDFGREIEEHERRYIADTIATLYAACLAAERTDEARAVAAVALEFDDSDATRSTLAAKAALAGVPADARRAWETEGAD